MATADPLENRVQEREAIRTNQRANFLIEQAVAAEIHDALILSDNSLAKAARSAMDATAYKISAELSYARAPLIKTIYSLLHGRRELLELISDDARRHFDEMSEDRSKTNTNGSKTDIGG